MEKGAAMPITKDKTAECLGRLQLLKRFPSGGNALVEIGKILNECEDDQRATEAVDRILRDYDDWMGPASFRLACKEPVRLLA